MNPLQDLAAKAAAFTTAACLLVTLPCGPALAQVPEGKATVSGPELLAIIKEDFLQRKYLVTGNLTSKVRGWAGGAP